MNVESPDLNPYATPATVSDAPIADLEPLRTPWLRRLLVLQAIVMVASLVVEAYDHESIVGSGPMFTLVGYGYVQGYSSMLGHSVSHYVLAPALIAGVGAFLHIVVRPWQRLPPQEHADNHAVHTKGGMWRL